MSIVLCGSFSIRNARAQDVLAENQDLAPLKDVGVRDRPRPEFDPLGISLAGYRVSPQLTISEAYDDNIYATDTDTVGDNLTTVTGAVSVQSPGQQPSVSASGGFKSQIYSHNNLENYLDWNGAMSLAESLGYRTSVNAGATVARNHLSRDDPSFPAVAVEPPSFDTVGALVEVRHDLPRGSLDFNANFRSLGFNDAQLPQGVRLSQDFKDRNDLTLDLRGNYLLGPTTSAFVRFVHESQTYRSDSAADGLDRDTTVDTVAGGSAFQVTNLMRGEIGIGVLHLKNHDPSQGSQTTLAFRANIEAYLTQLITAIVTVERTTGPADIAGSSNYVGTDVTAGLDYELRRNVILSAGVERMRRQYTGIDASETTSHGSVEARWLINRSLRANLLYTLSRRTSPLQTYLGQNFTDRVVEANVEFVL